MTLSVRAAFRRLRRSPAFAASVVLILALGIGANVAVFTIVNAVLLRSLPYGDPSRLVSLSESNLRTGQTKAGVLPGSVLDWEQRSHSFDAISMFWLTRVLVTNRQEPTQVGAAMVSPNFFQAMSVSPLIGRTFPARTQHLAGHEREIVISYALWQQWFGGGPNVIGKVLEVQGNVPLMIVGVMPPSFRFPRNAQVWQAQEWQLADGRGEPARWRQALGRLRPGVSVDAAARDLNQIEGQLAVEFPATNAGWTATVVPLAQVVDGNVRAPLSALLAAVTLVLLAACVNVGTLVLQRQSARRHELATRVALGADTPRLVTESAVEYGMLTLISVAAGLMLAWLVVNQLMALAPAEIPRLTLSVIDLRVIGYVVVVALATMVLTGVAPGMRSARIDVNAVLRSGMGGRVTRRGWRYLVAAELGVAVVLLCNAGLMVRTMLALGQLDLGFDPSNVATTELRLPLSRIATGRGRPEWNRLVTFYQNLVESVDAVPGVQRAALVATPALGGPHDTWLARSGIVSSEPDESPAWQPIQYRAVGADYFAVLHLPIHRGRGFSAEDQNARFLLAQGERPAGVAIVSEAAARSLWPGQDPIGKSLTIGGDSHATGRIVIGMVGDARDLAPDREPQPTIYVPFAQSPNLGVTLLVRGGAAEPPAVITAVRARLRATDPLLMIGPIGPFAARYAETIAPRRYLASVLGIFACFGLGLAGVGLYGLMAASVTQRLPEFAIRLALGATPEGLRGTVLREASYVVGIGLIAGAAGAWAGTRLLQTQLFGVGGFDAETWVVTIIVLAASALTAAWGPARRAARSDPGSMLRMS